ncbi:MAG: hypothetical protein JNM88_11055 [Chitinophagaceae bacterium]|nr:hypothetical protein [Chitinophagaceae bacterium]
MLLNFHQIKQLITIFILCVYIGCKERQGDAPVAAKPSPVVWDEKAGRQFQWDLLKDTLQYKVYLLRLTDSGYPEEAFTGKRIADFAALVPDSAVLLDGTEQLDLLTIIKEESNFSAGDCSTFHLNGGFLVRTGNGFCASLSMGCGYGQWLPDPAGPLPFYGMLTERGREKAWGLMDGVLGD